MSVLIKLVCAACGAALDIPNAPIETGPDVPEDATLLVYPCKECLRRVEQSAREAAKEE